MLNLLTDIAGLSVGHASDENLRSGVTCVLFNRPATAAVSILGGAPASRETALLDLDMAVEQVDAIVLSGGSTYGLDATAGVQAVLRERFRNAPPPDYLGVPIVVQASLFDLANGGDKDWAGFSPYADFGRQAALAAAPGVFALGSAGAGLGANTATVKGGIGSASMLTPQGFTMAALVAVNAVGSATVGDGPHFWAAPFERDAEYGGLGLPSFTPGDLRLRVKPSGLPAISAGTTIGLVATDAALTPAQTKRLAILAQDGLARAILPAHLSRDGDTMFAAATGPRPPDDAQAFEELCLAATLVTARAIARGVFEASSLGRRGELPCWHKRFGTAP
jgi:L-aminopeptidase/D-esterase-like protein